MISPLFRGGPRTNRRAIGLASGALLIVTAISNHAQAQSRVIERFALHGEGAFAIVLSDLQRQDLGYSVGFQGSGRLAFNLIDPLAVQATYSTWLLPSSAGLGQQTLVGGGLRFEPMIAQLGRLFVDANVGAGFTGPYTRLMFDVGIGFDFTTTSWLALGPVIRYGHLLTNEQDVRVDPQTLSVGVSLTLRVPAAAPAPVAIATVPRPPAPRPPPPDRDHDGVTDADDPCPDEASGAHPDPLRIGCPLHDTDNDGVFDNEDACVVVAASSHPDPERPGCPDEDDDSDGVLNHADQCRTQPQGIHPDPARPGCPAPDRDGDSVPDATDHCPDQPGAPSPDPRRNGCPGLVRIQDGQIRIAQPVFFATNRERILSRSNRVLQAVADALRALPEIHRVSVEGHTDDRGDDAVNMQLSQRRADSVSAWLTAHGIEATRVESHGFGETRPVANNHRSAGRAQNRRVEFHIIDPVSSAAPASAISTDTTAAPSAASAAETRHRHRHSSSAPTTRRPENPR